MSSAGWTLPALLTLIAALALVGCGGSQPPSLNPLGTTSPPKPGNYRGTFDTTGTVLVNVSSNGQILISAVNPQAGGGSFTGATTLSSTDNFSATLQGASPAATVTATGATYPNNIQMSLTGFLSAPSVSATFIGTSNPFVGNYSGQANGDTVGQDQTLTLTVTNASTANVSGSLTTTSSGTLVVTGNLNPVGTFTGTANLGTPKDYLTFVGAFTIGPSSPIQGSGEWYDFLNSADRGTWKVSQNPAPALSRR